WPLAALVLLVGVIWSVYGEAINTPFVFDDSHSIVENQSITQLWPLLGDAKQPGPLNPPKSSPTCGRPLVNLSFALNYHFGGLDPSGYHKINLLLHLFCAVLVGLIAWHVANLEYFGGRFANAGGTLAFLAALFWAIHPLQTETVVYITQRTELMVSLFYLA